MVEAWDCPGVFERLPKKEQAQRSASVGRVYMTVVLPQHLRDAIRVEAKSEEMPPAMFVRMIVTQYISAKRARTRVHKGLRP